MSTSVIDAISRLRSHFPSRNLPSPKRVPGPVPRAALAALPQGAQMDELRRLIAAGERSSARLFALGTDPLARRMVGFLDIPYIPEASLEAFDFAPLGIPEQIAAHYPGSQAYSVMMGRFTPGLSRALSTTLFPENFIGLVPRPEQPAFYFINRFVTRIRNVTLPIVRAQWSGAAFPRLRVADEASLARACAIWLHLHEHFHKTGPLPLPGALDVKSGRSAATFEELRVDMCTLAALRDLRGSGADFDLTFEVVLAERIIRYAVQYAPSSNFDARASVAILALLERDGVIAGLASDAVSLDESRLTGWVRDVTARMAAVETAAAAGPRSAAAGHLVAFIRALTQRDGDWYLPEFHMRAARVPQWDGTYSQPA